MVVVRIIVQSAAWTALLALGLCLLLTAGQDHYLGRSLISRRTLLASLGGLLAGAAAGGGAQALIGLLSIGWSVTGPWMLKGLFVLGWMLLGGLLGRGMALLIPNLKPGRAALAGAVGGGLGASAFLATSALLASTALGETLSRFAGAAILGLAIGSMVALVEVIFRKNWLEVRYGANEIRLVNLGDAPVSIGSDSKACVVWTPSAPPVALTYTLRDGRLTCTDGITGRDRAGAPRRYPEGGPLDVVARGSEATAVSTAAPYVPPLSRPAMPAATPGAASLPPAEARFGAAGGAASPRPGVAVRVFARGDAKIHAPARGGATIHAPARAAGTQAPNPRRFRRRARFRRTAPRRPPRADPPTPARLAAVRSRARRRSGTA